MNQTDLSLLDQMRITDLEFERRKAYIGFDDADVAALVEVRRIVLEVCDDLVERFYAAQTRVPEIALLIGDADTLRRLAAAMGQYVVELFSGLYDLEYVSDRLRIGLVHKRIGVDPTLYLSAMHQLRRLLGETIDDGVDDPALRHAAQVALDKLFTLDTTLVFETYVRMLVAEVEESRNRAERYAQELEEKVRERTRQLEELAHTDALTGLLNMRHIDHALTRALRGAQRRAEPVTVIFIDLPNTRIELLHPLGEASPVAAFLARNPAGGIHHLCFEVEDIRAARDRLLAEGARVLGDGEPKTGAHGKPVLFLHPKDFMGTLVELEQV